MSKKTLKKDIIKSISGSKGRFLSILLLMTIGSFALVGLKISGPNMRSTSDAYFTGRNLADISIISDYGLDKDDIELINKTNDADIEYGYLKDVTINNTNNSFRIFSKPEEISKFYVKDGRFPKSNDEIAIDNTYKNQYKIGSFVELKEPKDLNGETILTKHKFKVVGHISSSEIVSSKNLGQTTAGTGELKGYAVVNKEVFDSDVYMMSRIVYNDMKGVNPYSDKYTNLVNKHKKELEKLLYTRPERRLKSIKDEGQKEINDGYKKIYDARKEIDDNKKKLDDANIKIEQSKLLVIENEKKLKEEIKTAQNKIDLGKKELFAAQIKVNSQIAEKQSVLNGKKREYNSKLLDYNKKAEELKGAEKEISVAQNKLNSNKVQLEEANRKYLNQIEELSENKIVIEEKLKDSNISDSDRNNLNGQLAKVNAELTEVKQSYNNFKSEKYDIGIEEILKQQQVINQKKEQLSLGKAQLSGAKLELDSAKSQLDSAQNQIDTAKKTYQNEINKKSNQIEQAQNKLNSEKNYNEAKLNKAKQEIKDKEKEYDEAVLEFNDKKEEAEKEIKDKEEKLKDAQDTLNDLEKPVYNLDSRRETPGSEGYKIYNSVSDIIDSLANIFPIFMYFVAALVTSTTMTRFVDEERINLGTLKALGYSDRDVRKKFIVYGFVAGSIGSILGIRLGHTALPYIIYNAYSSGFTIPEIELHFYPGVTIVALLLSFASTVIPAYMVSTRELQEKPASLLLPKPPVNGSKILLERISFIWNRLSFTHKVTARNIFRYKKRMFMTVFGVSGSVALLFSGLSIQYSISGINERQFNDIIKYDLIVAKNKNLNDDEEKDIEKILNKEGIDLYKDIYYEEMSVEAGKKNDKQEIKLIAPENNLGFDKYINLIDRKSKKSIELSNDGVVISERLSKLLEIKKGDTIKLKDEDNIERTMKVSDITEMYTGHFIFMNKAEYEAVFKKDYKTNSTLVNLKESSISNAEKYGYKFMQLEGVKGVVQNTTLKRLINTIVNSLNQIMEVLIIVSIMLAMVIIYNLTTINVSERIRELSTIKVLGFFDKEVTMYIYRETILLSIIGIFVGYGLGELLHQYIMLAVPPEDVMFNPALRGTSFIIPFIIIIIVTILLGLKVHRNLKNVDMLEALKSVE